MTLNAETYVHQGVTVEINYEEFDLSHSDPREGDGNLSTFYIYRPGYELGDEQLRKHGFDEIECPVCGEHPQDDCGRCGGFGTVEPTLTEWLAGEKAISFTPLFILEHSGMTISSGGTVRLDERRPDQADTDPRGRFRGDGEGWDTSFSGFALVRAEDLERTGCTEEDLPRIVEDEVAQYALYLEGQVFWYLVGRGTPFEDSCHGFLGLDRYLRDEANRAAEYVAERISREACERADWEARGVLAVD